MTSLRLIAASDDYLLEEARREAVGELEAALGVTAETFGEEVTPEQLALEVISPSLFAAERLLVVEDVRTWLETSTPRDAPKVTKEVDLELLVAPLVATLDNGLPSGVAVVLGAWCGGKPKGKLVDLCARHGAFRWVASPPTPKPWETVTLSAEQKAVLDTVLRRAAGEVVFTRAAAELLMERLGFAPRQLVREVEKLVVAAGAAGKVDEALVRALTFPAERSLEVVRKAILAGDLRPVVDLLAAASSGQPVRDFQGKRIEAAGVATVVFAQVATLLAQMLDVRAAARRLGAAAELDPKRCEGGSWYNRTFKEGLGPRLVEALGPDSPMAKKDGKVSVYTLSQVFAGAARYRDEQLRRWLAAAGDTEARLRSKDLAIEALTTWLAEISSDCPADRPV